MSTKAASNSVATDVLIFCLLENEMAVVELETQGTLTKFCKLEYIRLFSSTLYLSNQNLLVSREILNFLFNVCNFWKLSWCFLLWNGQFNGNWLVLFCVWRNCLI